MSTEQGAFTGRRGTLRFTFRSSKPRPPVMRDVMQEGRIVSINRYIIPLSWGWGAAALVSGVLVALLSGWTLLHTYTPVFCLTVMVFAGSILTVPALVALGAWEWRSGRVSLRVFLLHFVVPQAFVVAGVLIAYVAESVRSHAA